MRNPPIAQLHICSFLFRQPLLFLFYQVFFLVILFATTLPLYGQFVLSNLLERVIEGTPVAITGVPQWEQQKSEISRRVLDVMGNFPPGTVPLQNLDISRDKMDGYIRLKVNYYVEAGDFATAYLLIPDNIRGKAPAVIAMHRTVREGKNHVVGLSENTDFHYGVELVRRGYVVLAPDCITAGERIYPGYDPFVTAPFDSTHPEWSATGKMIWDHMRGVDYLLSLPFVDELRIGAIGHSLGGTNAFLLAAFDSRIRAVVCNTGFSTIAGDANPYRWSRDEWFVFFPQLRPYLDIKVLPFDFHEILAMIAPRALLNIAARNDRVFPNWEWVVASVLEVSRVYHLYNQDEKFTNYMHDNGHTFPAEVRTMAYDWLDGWLK